MRHRPTVDRTNPEKMADLGRTRFVLDGFADVHLPFGRHLFDRHPECHDLIATDSPENQWVLGDHAEFVKAK